MNKPDDASPPHPSSAAQDNCIIRLDYPIYPKPRYGYGKPLHPGLYEVLRRSKDVYADCLRGFARLADDLARIPVKEDVSNPARPYWGNIWFSGIDPVSLYGFLVKQNPARYFEVGSGHSTRFANQAIQDHSLRTKITSVDPYPRAEIDALCHEVVRKPLEEAPIEMFGELEDGDILVIDNSHRVFTNSDATVVFLDILPNLKPGVLVGIHDILLPNDYPPDWNGRFYSEQYVLAAYLLARGTLFDVVLPAAFLRTEADLMSILAPFWARSEMAGSNPSGSMFWLRMR